MSVKIYTTGWCLPCKNAKKLLSDNSVPYEELNIEELGITRNDLYNLTGGRTVPQNYNQWKSDRWIHGFIYLTPIRGIGSFIECFCLNCFSKD